MVYGGTIYSILMATYTKKTTVTNCNCNGHNCK